MGFSYLLETSVNVEAFKTRFNISPYVNIAYCYEGDIKDQRLPWIFFFHLMSILEGGVRFPIDPLLLRTLSFYRLSPDQCLPNFYRVVSCVGGALTNYTAWTFLTMILISNTASELVWRTGTIFRLETPWLDWYRASPTLIGILQGSS